MFTQRTDIASISRLSRKEFTRRQWRRFNGVKGKPYNTEYVSAFLREQLTQSVASWKGDNDPVLRKRFFLQHVALETFYYLGNGSDLPQLIPFMGDDSYHVQISACRAISRTNSRESKELLMKFIESRREGFAKGDVRLGA